MKNILLIGAGRSSAYLIHHLGKIAPKYNLKISIADKNLELAQSKVQSDCMVAKELDVNDFSKLEHIIKEHSFVISMLPAHMHFGIAKICLENNISMLTASYRSDAMKSLDAEANAKGLFILSEMGVDPGIDHISALHLINQYRNKGHQILDFESFTGGLPAPGSDNNEWQYKFTWNPRNVVIAGQGNAVKFIQENEVKYIPYQKLFRRTEPIEIEGYGYFEGYANRDSMKYCSLYDLENARTMYRGTLRRPGFCKAWNCFVQLGLTDDSYIFECNKKLTHRNFINAFLPYHPSDSVEIKFRHYLNIPQDEMALWRKMTSLNLFSDEKIELENATPAKILENILSKQWTLKKDERDMIAMYHILVHEKEGKTYKTTAEMIYEGEQKPMTAMAKTVGLPMALAIELLLEKKINPLGSVIPTTEDLYKPLSQALANNGIHFKEKTILINA